jgi:type I restriction-modification system DNA methylase subunit/restriction endonuclease S subunit
MPKIYSCDSCKKVFNSKKDLTIHQNNISSCIKLSEINEIKEVKNDDKEKVKNVLRSCLNILRDNEGLTGEKALRTLSYWLILKLLEPHFGGEINIDDYEYNFDSYFEENVIERNKKRLLHIVRFSNLSNEKDDDIPNLMSYAWDIILSTNPTTKNIFLKGKGFDIQYKSTYKKLIDKLNSLDLSQSENDILGDAYEEVIQDIMTGKVLGQFFTPPLAKKIMVNLINPQIHPDGKIDTCCDPTMGTGGFLITYLKHILQQAKNKNIKPDWDFIKTQGIYGKELEPDTYQLAVSNMLISSGHMFEGLDNGDSIRQPITRKFDNILANPPFGIKGLKYDDFQNSLKSKYLPIKTDNAVSLFIQAIIYMLNTDGKCAVVLPDGQDLFSKTNKTLISVREYLLKTCDLKEIIYLPSGIFTNTSIKTCIFYFIKKIEGSDVLETKIKVSKTQKEKGRDYKFIETHQTTKVAFYDYNTNEDMKNLLVEVPIEKIVSNSYSLNYAEYMKDETEEEQYEEGVVVKTLGEVCKFLSKSKRNAKYGNKEGLYPFFKSSIKVDSYVDEPDYEEESLIIGDGGEPNINYGVKFSTSDHCYILQNKNKLLLNLKYCYYYLYHNLDMMKQLYTGVAIKNISKTNIEGIKIPIPSLERQQEIVKYLDFIYEKANKTSNEKIAELKQLNEFCLSNQINLGVNVVKRLEEVCKFDIGGTPSRSKNEYYENGNNLWVSVRELNGGYIYDTKEKITDLGVQNSSVKLFAKDTILFSFKLSIGKTAIVGNPLYTNEAIAGILSKNNDLLNNKYLYYYLTINDFSKLGSGILGNGSLNKKSLEQIKIPIPSLERQKEIVEYCEYNDTLIKQLEKEIENNKKQAQQFITAIVKEQIQNEETEEKDDTSLENTEPIKKVQDEIIPIEEEVFIIPKVKKNKKTNKTKKPIVNVEENNKL